MYLENPYQRSLTAKRLLKANLKAKVAALSLREPDELKKISFFYDSRAWLKAYFQYVMRVSKTDKKNTSFRSSKNRVFMQFFDTSTSIFIDEPKGAWDTVAIKLEGLTLHVSPWDNGAEEVYTHLNLVFGFTPLITELERLRKVSESTLGLPLAPSYKEDSRMRELRLYWQGPRTAHVAVTFEALLGLSSTNTLISEAWNVGWEENTGTYKTEYFEGSTLEEVLDQLPEEFDSDLIHFTNRDNLKALTKDLKKIFPGVKLTDESYLQRGLGALKFKTTTDGNGSISYQELTQTWELWAHDYINVLFVDEYTNKPLHYNEIPWDISKSHLMSILEVFEKNAPSQVPLTVSPTQTPHVFVAQFNLTTVKSKDEALHILKLWAKWLDTVRTMPFPVEV